MGPAEKLRRFIDEKGWSQEKAGEAFECSQVTVSKILRGETLPRRLIANAIERCTAESTHGQIRSEEWDEEERRRLAKTGS